MQAGIVTLLLVAGRLTPTTLALLEACASLGLPSAHVLPRLARRRARPGDVALARLDVSTSLDGVEPGLWELARLEEDGVRVLNPPAALLTAHDKLATALALARAGVAHPRTAQVDTAVDTASLDYPLVVKPRFGSWGRDVELCRTPAELDQCLRRLAERPWFRRQGALVQELVEPLGYDLRLVVANGQVVGAVERHAAPGEWRTNVALGAARRPTDPPLEARLMAQAAAAAIGCDLVGVDLLPTPGGGWVVLEVNGAVDFTAAYALDGEDPFLRAVEALELAPAAPAVPLAGAVA
jgi:RimK family alpha-L-glutamate ligase